MKNNEQPILSALAVLNNIKQHLIYDKNYKQICYSGELVNALKTINEFVLEKIERGE